MSDLDALLARSKDPGAFVERRQFTLSRDKALEKMRQFTLRHPGQYALEIVQAAVMAGARWMFVDAESHQVTLGWVGGTAITSTQLDGLFDYLFVSESVAETRPLRQIAIAVNVLMQRKPELLRIESGDLNGAARLDMLADGTGTVGIPAATLDGTYIHVRFRTPGWHEMFRSTRAPPAVELIETECLYSPTTIFVNGEGPFGWDQYMPLKSLYLARQEAFSTEERNGWIGVGPAHEKNLVTFVIGGVRISRREVPELGPNIQGVIRDDNLVKTADMSDIVEDENWRRLLWALRPAAERLQPDWDLPELEPVADPVEEAEPIDDSFVPPALEEGLTLLGQAGLVSLSSLADLRRDQPLYWIAPEDLEALAPVLDPQRFEERVFVLTAEQARAVVGELPNLSLHAIAPSDASFVVEQRAKAVRVESVLIELRECTITLRLHRDGRLPGWGQGPGVPVLLSRRGRTIGTRRLALNAPGLSAIVEVDATDPDVLVELLDTVWLAIQKHAWRLILDAESGAPRASIGPAQQVLARTLLLEGMEVLPVPGADPKVRLPEAAGLLDVPLVDSGVTARHLLRVMGTHETIDVALTDIETLAPLTEQLGVGHLVHPDQARMWLVEVRWDGVAWELADTDSPGASIRALVRLGPTFAPLGPDGWQRVEAPHPVLLGAQRDPEDSVPWAEGWEALAAAMSVARTVDAGPWQEGRRDDLLRLGRLALDSLDHDGQIAASDGTPRNVRDVLTGRAQVAYRGGPELVEPHTVLITADEAALLAPLADPALRWRFDDAPSVWTQTPEVGPDWVAVVALSGDAGTGWLGLRYPYDPTGSVFIRRGWRTMASSALDRHIRCHGFVHARGSEASGGLAELHTAAFSLMERVLSQLRTAEPDRRTALVRYCVDFAWMGLDSASPIPAELADRLADAVSIPMPDGDPWGSMRLWLQTAPTVRPPFPHLVHGFGGLPIDIEAHRPASSVASTGEGFEALAVVHSAVQRMVPDLDVTVGTTEEHRVRAWGASRLHVEIGLRDVLVAAAWSDDRSAMARVLLRVARAVYVAEAKNGNPRDFLALQRAALDTVRSLPGGFRGA